MLITEKLPAGHHLLKIKEVREFLRCSTATVYRLMESGKLPYTRVGSHRRIRFEDIEAYLVRSSNSRKKTA